MDRGNEGDAPRATVLFAEKCHERNQGLGRDHQVRDDIPKDVNELLGPFIGQVREKIEGGKVKTNGRPTKPLKGPAKLGTFKKSSSFCLTPLSRAEVLSCLTQPRA